MNLHALFDGFMAAMAAMNGDGNPPPLNADQSASPMSIIGSSNGKSFQFQIKFNAKDVAEYAAMATSET